MSGLKWISVSFGLIIELQQNTSLGMAIFGHLKETGTAEKISHMTISLRLEPEISYFHMPELLVPMASRKVQHTPPQNLTSLEVLAMHGMMMVGELILIFIRLILQLNHQILLSR